MGYQVGVTPVQMAAAANAIANGGELVGAANRPRHHSQSAPHRTAAPGRSPRRQRRYGRGADRDHGTSRRGRHRQVGADGRLHHRREDRNRGQARTWPLLDDQLQRLIHRLRAIAQAGSDDPRRHRLAARQGHLRRRRRGADLQAHCRSDDASSWRRAQSGADAARPGRLARSARGDGADAGSHSEPAVATRRRYCRPGPDAGPARPRCSRSRARAGAARYRGAHGRRRRRRRTAARTGPADRARHVVHAPSERRPPGAPVDSAMP